MTTDLAGKNYYVTGANTGIGKHVASELARRGARVILACRNREKADPVVDEIKRSTGNDKVELALLDLADFASVRAAADEFLARGIPLHGLVNNAGLVTRGMTKQGFELIFGVNHLGHYLLTRLLLDHIKKTSGARIVHVASNSHLGAKGIDWAALRRSTASIAGYSEYQVSKLCNVLFSEELARRLDGTGVHTYAVNPGSVATDVWRRIPRPFVWLMKRSMLSVEEGSKSTLLVTADPAYADETGLYYDRHGKPRPPNPLVTPALAKELWDKSAEWCGLQA
ncbi:MAG TPA: SDR family oxidoreductase [Kofleriaceae bacterium]|jgi:NAD(P)-dependent dehydrogenase (short-subunit alcohol dehydrogenase family)